MDPSSTTTVAKPCLNCGATLDGPFCAHCGQKAVHPKPTLHELLHDALEEFLHFDGKIVQTLRTLVTRPGQVTIDMVEGRRARYIAPLRLYLTISVVYFLLASAMPSRNVSFSVNFPGTKKTTVTTGQRVSDEDRRALEEAERDAPPWVRPLIHRIANDPQGLVNDIVLAWPKAMFVLLPIFAVIVAIFYHRRHFVEHMYFALHIHAFAFLTMALSPLVGLLHLRWLSPIVGLAVLIGIPVYVHIAFKRVYGETHVLTMVKETGVGLLYTVAMIPAIFAAALWVAAHPH